MKRRQLMAPPVCEDRDVGRGSPGAVVSRLWMLPDVSGYRAVHQGSTKAGLRASHSPLDRLLPNTTAFYAKTDTHPAYPHHSHDDGPACEGLFGIFSVILL